MLINGDNLATAFRGFSTVFNDALAAAPQHAERLAMMVSSSTREQVYPFLAAAPKVREWLGARQVHQLAAHDFAIRNRTFELTVEVPRDDLADDQIGAYKGLFAELGHSVAEFREELVFELLAEGFDRTGWDGVPFFSASHPITDATIGTVTTWSNFGGGSGTPWYLLDVSRPIRPFIRAGSARRSRSRPWCATKTPRSSTTTASSTGCAGAAMPATACRSSPMPRARRSTPPTTPPRAPP